MKQLFLSLFLCSLSTLPVSAQQTPLQDFIDKYKQDKAFTSAFLSKDMFEVAVNSEVDEKDWKKIHQVVRNIGLLSVLAADSIDSAPELYKEALAAVPTSDFDELLAVQDGKDKVRIWAREESGIVTDLVLLVGTTDEFVLVCFSGKLELENLTDLAKLLDANAVENLAKTSQALAPEFSISPNPCKSAFNFQYNSAGDPAAQLNILDQNGRQLSMLTLPGATTQSVSVTDLPAGIYWVQLKTEKGKVGVKQLQVVK